MPHSLASSDSVSSSRSLSTIPPTLQQLPDLPRQDLQNLIASISQSATLITQVYPRLRSIEKVLDTARPRFDPSTLRYLLPDAFVKAILVHLPAADFSVSSRDTVGKLHKVCQIWQIDSKLLLFQIGHDYGKKRGQPFFTALLVLAKLNHKWDSCLKLLINQVSVRQRLGGHHKCVQRVDVQNVITILTPPRNSVSETDSNEPTPIVSRPNQESQQAIHSQASTCKAFPSHKSPAVAATNAVGVERQDSDLDSNIDSDLDSDLDSNIELDIQVDQDLNQNIDATNEHKNFPQGRQPVATSASSKAPLKAPPAVRDSPEASLDGTLSEEQTSLDQDRHQKRHLTGAEEDREIEESEEPEKARRTSSELGYTLPKTQKAPPGTDVEYQHDLSPPSLHSPLLLSFPLSSPSRSPTPEANHHFDVELKGHTFPEADVEGERREADKNTDGTNNTPASSSFPTKRCLSFSETDSQFTLVPALPNMEGKDQADGPKRFRVEPSPPLVPAEETDALLLDTTWVKGALLNGALGSLCDLLAPDVCYLDSAEVSRMAEDKYSPRSETLSLILATKLYDSMTSDKHTNAAQQLIGAFFKHYLPQTPYFSRVADPCLTNQSHRKTSRTTYTAGCGDGF
ncbi:uncharacterized protein CTRU02_215762 [Colletotrichum truncatum]|uniref:Uncharacterized protein n=1 Tax=Colletotrichum truncatum TaxID=5467 RepID=A0ACC3YBU7_COLTU